MEQSNRVPSLNEMEFLFVNNEKLDLLQIYLNRFNPIKTMKMEHMEIRHSAILAWLLDPQETHGLNDRFLKAFLGEALRGNAEAVQQNSDKKLPTALGISQSDLGDTEIRCEWQHIDIFILSQTNGWAFIVENKFKSTQHKGQLEKYKAKVEEIYKGKLKIQGIFLSLLDEEPEDTSYVTIKYEMISGILGRILRQQSHFLAREVATFLRHYLDILKDATGMSEEHNEMEKLAKQLYRDHKKVLDFVIEHGASTDFAIAARSVFGEDPDHLSKVIIDNKDFVFSALGSNIVSFIPVGWYEAFGETEYNWPGCENWWAGFPLICWFKIWSGNNGTEGQVNLYAEVGPVASFEIRKKLIEAIGETSKDRKKIKFQKGAADEAKKYSKFLKKNSVKIDDIHDADEISKAMKKLLKDFDVEFKAISKELHQFLNYGVAKG